jgi:hypothetical protein
VRELGQKGRPQKHVDTILFLLYKGSIEMIQITSCIKKRNQ